MKNIYIYPITSTILCIIGIILLSIEYNVSIFLCYIFTIIIGLVATSLGDIQDDFKKFK